jgi:6-pyruvoyltetrahydropterin/6-carboxytetrahydropterin synthase
MAGTYELFVKTDFSAAHCLKGYEGNCSRVHGHNWTVTLFLKCGELDEIGIGVDFRKIKTELAAIIGRLDHKNLNDLEPFRDRNPTSENIARFVYREAAKKINSGSIRVSRVTVSETGSTGATYWED